jgi:Tol biopolymer transport system component
MTSPVTASWTMRAFATLMLGTLLGCAAAPSAQAPKIPVAGGAASGGAAAPSPALPRSHLADVRQLTFGGENAEAYWSFDGNQLVLQARGPGEDCDRIYRMDLRLPQPIPIPVSSGAGAATCSYFLPGDREVIFASTHLAGAACPPRPDRSQGYVWAIHPGYDIFRGAADGTGLRRLTDAPGYDAEATVCPKDGSIVFTSVRDGDLELYRMDADGKNQRRLTHTVGYDGGAFFSADCSKIVWRAARPRSAEEEAEYKRLLGQHLVKPSKLEIWVANADGSEARQITYLDAASFAPSFFPSGQRVIFSSNTGDPRGREFDLWAVDVDGGHLERITTEPGFDGFPMFSPDGTRLAFASNRATPPGSHDTNVFVARWVDRIAAPADMVLAPGAAEAPSAADRIAADVRWLADPARQGRGVGTPGLAEAGAYIERRMQALGLAPAGDDGGYRQGFPVTVDTIVEEATLTVAGEAVAADGVRPARFSASGEARAPLVLADYGIVDEAHAVDDYKKVKAKGSIVVVRRFVPAGPPFDAPDAERTFGDLRKKAWLARERGARALVVVDAPRGPKAAGDEAPFPTLASQGADDAGIPILFAKRAALAPALARLEAGKPVEAALAVKLTHRTAPAFNVVGRLEAGAPPERRLPGVVVVGAHYDHLGMGGRHSLAPDREEPHLGADDNASGTAAVLEIARALALRRAELSRPVVFVAFSGEEEGVLGSTHFTRQPPAGLKLDDVVAMVNLDMVGRMRDDHLDVLGARSALEWPPLVEAACAASRVSCTIGGGDGLGPSDQMPFYMAGAPVVHLFTGVHADYHKPSDAPAAINAAGAGAVARVGADLVVAAGARPGRLTYQKLAVPPRESDMRSFNASLGTIPDYAGPPGGAKGVLLSGVRPGSAADKAGLRRGDILVRLGRHPIDNVQDFSYVLNASKPGETVTAVVIRDGRELPVQVTFQEGHRR